MKKILLLFVSLYFIDAHAQEDIIKSYVRDFDSPQVPPINVRILKYLDSLRMNNVYDDLDVVNNAFAYAGAKLPSGKVYGVQYSDLHEMVPGDIIYILPNFHKGITMDKKVLNVDYSYLYDQVGIITFVSDNNINFQYSLLDYRHENINSLHSGMITLSEINLDRIVFYHPVED